MIEIRPLRDDELLEAVNLWLRTKRHSLAWLESEQGRVFDDDLAYFRDHIRPRAEIWVAVENETLLGWMALERDHIDQLFVDPAQQGRGIGTRLVDTARAHSSGHLWLFTQRRNDSARRFYERRGFRAVAFGVSPPPESEPDVRYEWDVGRPTGR